MILRYDQLPRHLFRGTQSNHIIEYFLQNALLYADTVDHKDLTPVQLVFALLPWRHSKDPTLVAQATCIAWKSDPSNPLIQRFLKSSYKKFPLKGADHVVTPCTSFDRSILKYDPGATATPIPFKYPETCHSRYVISLSGGVDSMVCSWKLRDGIMAAVHINYGNRPTSDEEAGFVSWWCGIIGIPLFVRKISEIQRAPCKEHGLRETYEEYTRQVRYHCYKERKPFDILLGHNKDDCFENICTNIVGKCKYDNLEGMEYKSVQDGITFIRPFLDISKEEIIDMAHKHNIPYLPNSTPTWSQRGQIRAKVVPALTSWNPKFVESLFELSNTVKDLQELCNEQVWALTPVISWPSAATRATTFTMDKIPKSKCFWKTLFQHLAIPVASKSLNNIIERMESASYCKVTVPLNFECNKSCKLTIRSTKVSFTEIIRK